MFLKCMSRFLLICLFISNKLEVKGEINWVAIPSFFVSSCYLVAVNRIQHDYKIRVVS